MGVSHVWCCAMGIATGRVAWVVLGHGDCRWACRVGGAVSWGLLTQPLSGWRRVLGIADQGVSRVWRAWRCAMGMEGERVAWAVLCHGDCWWACRVGGAVSWGLLTEPLSGWRRVLGIAYQGVLWVAPYLGRRVLGDC